MKQYLLAILSGPHAGTTKRLPEGRYRVGRAVESDVIVADPRVPDRLVTLELRGDRLRLVDPTDRLEVTSGSDQQSIAPSTNHDGKLPIIVKFFDTQLMIAAEAAEQPSENPTTPPTAWSRTRERLGNLSAGMRRALPTVPRPSPALLVALPAIVAIAVVGPSMCVPRFGATDARAQRVEIDRIARSLGVSGTIEVAEVNGAYEIKGVVDDPEIALELERRLTDAGIVGRVQMTDRRRRDLAMESVTSGFRGRLRASSVGVGKVRLEGVAADRAELDRVVQALRRDVPGVSDVEVGAVPADLLVERSRQELKQLGLAHNLTVAPLADGIRIAGRIAAQERPAWDQFLKWFDTEAGQLARLEPVLGPENDDPPALGRIEAVYSGPQPYVIADGGRKFAVGSMVGGWRIERIEAEAITLRRGQRELVIKL